MIELFDRLGRTLTRKFLLLLAGFLILQAAQLGAGVFGVLHAGEEGAFINEAGRQRMRTLLLASLAQEAVAAGAWRPEQRKRFDEAIAASDAYFARYDESAAGRATRYRALDDLRRGTRADWERGLKPLLSAVDPAASPPAARAALARYRTLALEKIGHLDEFVAALERHLREDTRTLAVVQSVVLALTLLLFVAGTLVVRTTVIRPLRRLIDSTHAIAGGTYDQRVAIATRDEVGELAATFNRMAVALGQKDARLRALNQAAIAFAMSANRREVLDEALDRGIHLVGGKAACLALHDAGEKRPQELHCRGLSQALAPEADAQPGDAIAEAFASGHYIQANAHGGAQVLSAAERAQGLRCRLCLPLSSHANDLGAMCFYLSDRDAFEKDEIDILATFTHLVAGAIENVQLQEHALSLAETDALTGLYNRRKFEQRLDEEMKRSRRTDAPFALLLIDIDHFKRINDTHGHPSGDAVLKDLGRLFLSEARDIDLAARIGGEEFMQILPGNDSMDAKLVAERIRRAVASTAFALPDGARIRTTVSIGVACYPNCAESTARLIERVDQALYSAKQSGRDRVVAYEDMLRVELERNPQRIAELLNQSLENARAIATAVDMKAAHLRSHSHGVERYALRLGEELRLSARDMETLKFAGLLHDVGIIAVPESVLNKPGPFTEEERSTIEQHQTRTAEILKHVPALREAVPAVRHHHERYDGRGYPYGLKGEEIPLLARILAVADAYCAMVEERPQRRALTPPEVRSVLDAGAGKQFDPVVIAALLRILDRK